MTIVLAGGSGFLGRRLAARLEHDRHNVVILTRRPRANHRTDVAWQPDGSTGSLAGHPDGGGAGGELVGEGIAHPRARSAPGSARSVMVSSPRGP